MRIGGFWKTQLFWVGHFQFFFQFFFSSPWKSVTNFVFEWMGLNFYYYDGLQPKTSAGMINEHECMWIFNHSLYLQWAYCKKSGWKSPWGVDEKGQWHHYFRDWYHVKVLPTQLKSLSNLTFQKRLCCLVCFC